ncbi:hypothetical protein BUALT_Bualt07G0085600 [Buddleja alternifolia]|uniref:Uncharacterized protein n=1 Tax=Buddleja alternifolia TaxID=168488 RepID=A0AAV6XK38_9LAMI|nr:hypothetical protein BUALT_Bualt07G0085600 [Buddleja alternifolia]
MIMTQEEEEAYSLDIEDLDTCTDAPHSEDMTISINAISSNTDINTLRIKGLVKNSSIHILIDSGSTHCFLDETVANQLGCTMEITNPMLSVADGNKMISRTFCPKFSWEIQGTKFTYPMRIIKLGGCDVVLGGDWLRLHSPVEFDYHKMKFTICKNGKKFTMKAITESAELQLLSGRPSENLDHPIEVKSSRWIKGFQNKLGLKELNNDGVLKAANDDVLIKGRTKENDDVLARNLKESNGEEIRKINGSNAASSKQHLELLNSENIPQNSTLT